MQTSLKSRLFSYFLMALAVCYGAGFTFHLLDLLDLRLHFSEMNPTWKMWTLSLMTFDLVAAVGLCKKARWGEFTFIVIAVTQLIAYTQFKTVFGPQLFLVWFHVASLALYAALRFVQSK